MKKTMTKEVTTTSIKLGRVKLVDGMPIVEPLNDELMLGNVSLEKAQKAMRKQHGDDVTVFGVEANTQKYKMSVEDFIRIAKRVEENEGEEIEELQEA